MFSTSGFNKVNLLSAGEITEDIVITIATRNKFEKSRVCCAFFIQCILLIGSSNLTAADPKLGYTVDYLTDTIYSVDLQTGVYNPAVLTSGGIDFVDLAFLNSTTLYALGYNERKLYSIDLTNQTYQLVSTNTIGDSSELVYSVAIANPQTAYVVGFESGTIYTVNLNNGISSPLVTLSSDAGLTNIAILNESTAYVVGYRDNNLYKIDLLNGTYNLVTPTPVGSPGMSALEGIALTSSDTAYVVGNMDANVYRVDLNTGAFTLVTPSPIGAPDPLINLAENEGSGFTVNNLGGEVYKVNLADGSYSILAMIPGVNLSGMAIFYDVLTQSQLSQIPTSNLNGNNLRLANYLNENAPQSIVSLFSNLSEGLADALQSAAPTRNACSTYASQSSSLALSRLIRDHERQKRFQHKLNSEISQRKQLLEPNELLGELLVDASDEIPMGKTKSRLANPYTIWLEPFGVYTEIQAQSQTPAFAMGLGGVAAAFDYNGINQNLVGFGGAYTYTHVHEKSSAGHANINQGYLFLYGTLNSQEWYVDLAVSGGYYKGKQERHIFFPGVQETATSKPQGWQLSPHFQVGYNKLGSDRFSSKWFGVEPFLLLDWVANWEEGLKEKGASGLNMGQKARFCSLFHGETGFNFQETATWNWGILAFREKIAYSYQKAFHTGTINAFLLGSPGNFTVETLSSAQNLGIVEFSMLCLGKKENAPYFDIRYEGQFSIGYQLHQGTIEIGKNF